MKVKMLWYSEKAKKSRQAFVFLPDISNNKCFYKTIFGKVVLITEVTDLFVKYISYWDDVKFIGLGVFDHIEK